MIRPFISVTAFVASSGELKQTKPNPLERPPSVITYNTATLYVLFWLASCHCSFQLYNGHLYTGTPVVFKTLPKPKSPSKTVGNWHTMSFLSNLMSDSLPEIICICFHEPLVISDDFQGMIGTQPTSATYYNSCITTSAVTSFNKHLCFTIILLLKDFHPYPQHSTLMNIVLQPSCFDIPWYVHFQW